MRRLATASAISLCLVLLLPATNASAGIGVTSTPFGGRQALLPAICKTSDGRPYDVQMQEDKGLTLTTFTDSKGKVVKQVISGSTVTHFAGAPGAIDIESSGVTTLTPNKDGTTTIVQVGYGPMIDTGRNTGSPDLVWFTGVVVSRGVVNKDLLLIDPLSQVNAGWEPSICEMLVTGIKTRHQ